MSVSARLVGVGDAVVDAASVDDSPWDVRPR